MSKKTERVNKLTAAAHQITSRPFSSVDALKKYLAKTYRLKFDRDDDGAFIVSGLRLKGVSTISEMQAMDNWANAARREVRAKREA